MAAFLSRSASRVCASIAAAPGEKTVDVEALQRCRQKSDRAHHRSAAADPIEHREARQPAVLLRVVIQLAARARDRDRMLSRNPSPACSKRASASSMPLRVSFVPPDFEITTASVVASLRPSCSKTRSKPSGIGVVEEVHLHCVVRSA